MASERVYFALCLTLGRLLRAGRYAKVIIEHDRVCKQRSFYAPFLITMGRALVKVLNTGMQVLAQREWFEREKLLYHKLHATSVHVDAGGILVLPRLPGRTLAEMLEDPLVDASARARAIQLATYALVEFHSKGFTHADAMAENVMIDVEAGVASWFDFETIHDESRAITWRRADDVRALLATCLLRTPAVSSADTVRLIIHTYSDAEVAGMVATFFKSGFQRPLMFHLGQAPLSFQAFRRIDALLRA